MELREQQQGMVETAAYLDVVEAAVVVLQTHRLRQEEQAGREARGLRLSVVGKKVFSSFHLNTNALPCFFSGE